MTRQRSILTEEHVRALKPALRAYVLCYAASTGPRLFGFLKMLRRRDLSMVQKSRVLVTILRTSTQINRFPIAGAILVAGPTITTRLVSILLRLLSSRVEKAPARSLDMDSLSRLRFLCTFLSAWLAFNLLNRDKEWACKRARSRGAIEFQASKTESPNKHYLPDPSYRPSYAGKTIDFTLFALCRALDVLVISMWTRTRSSRHHPEHAAPRLAKLGKKLVDPWVFATSASIIMWSWFYSPERLPRAYNHWISTAADIDSRLITALRRCREGEFVYGQDSGQAPLLMSLCDELGLPQAWGDPSKTIPIPCELYHCGRGSSCEIHGLSRFMNSFKFSMELYLPLQLLTKITRPGKTAVLAATGAAARSSSFLAAFVSLFYYSVCLARTRLGPKIFSPKTVTAQMWDSGLCVLAGCMACGWSILIEQPNRRQEIAFFVAPRALATLLPRVYDKAHQRREQIVFALSVAIVLNAAKTGPDTAVRGVLGRVLRGVLKE
ncbi:uncharacterized protein HMPREF1541_02587 [Cyphellophora europaea CBS 101466]|uniref:Integral membrane protein n=1 Tax=Cyphellophora europaea (strain CBS 101466) TaxID=1220924 RepID=W2S5Y0_CYPE1|nr:uncharacterized protein HMPREF1541_02587 [Cyphellophora europaea CBS 101466]ETN43428.1 hypothetical protein HMPREF1541_02587 [Cyphellophora europaea CBS 101466]